MGCVHYNSFGVGRVGGIRAMVALCSFTIVNKRAKVNEVSDLYSAFTHSRRSSMDRTVSPANYTVPASIRVYIVILGSALY